MAVEEEKTRKKQSRASVQIKASKPKSAEKILRVKLVRSLIGQPRKQREVAKGLGLRKIDSEVMRKDCPEIWGMIKKISHLLEVEVLEKK